MLDHSIQLWRIDLKDPASRAADLRTLLSSDEEDRAARFHFDEDRARFICCRATLRKILGNQIGLEPRDVTFRYTPFGKPFVETIPAGRQAWSFNLSHSGDLALLAIASSESIGVDIERLRTNLDCAGLSRRFFSTDEAQRLSEVDPNDLARTFFSIWTRKEALIKGHGKGLSLPLDQFTVSLLPGETGVRWHGAAGENDLSGWSVLPVEVGEGYVAAVAIPGNPRPVLWH